MGKRKLSENCKMTDIFEAMTVAKDAFTLERPICFSEDGKLIGNISEFEASSPDKGVFFFEKLEGDKASMVFCKKGPDGKLAISERREVKYKDTSNLIMDQKLTVPSRGKRIAYRMFGRFMKNSESMAEVAEYERKKKLLEEGELAKAKSSCVENAKAKKPIEIQTAGLNDSVLIGNIVRGIENQRKAREKYDPKTDPVDFEFNEIPPANEQNMRIFAEQKAAKLAFLFKKGRELEIFPPVRRDDAFDKRENIFSNGLCAQMTLFGHLAQGDMNETLNASGPVIADVALASFLQTTISIFKTTGDPKEKARAKDMIDFVVDNIDIIRSAMVKSGNLDSFKVRDMYELLETKQGKQTLFSAVNSAILAVNTELERENTAKEKVEDKKAEMNKLALSGTGFWRQLADDLEDEDQIIANQAKKVQTIVDPASEEQVIDDAQIDAVNAEQIIDDAANEEQIIDNVNEEQIIDDAQINEPTIPGVSADEVQYLNPNTVNASDFATVIHHHRALGDYLEAVIQSGNVMRMFPGIPESFFDADTKAVIQQSIVDWAELVSIFELEEPLHNHSEQLFSVVAGKWLAMSVINAANGIGNMNGPEATLIRAMKDPQMLAIIKEEFKANLTEMGDQALVCDLTKFLETGEGFKKMSDVMAKSVVAAKNIVEEKWRFEPGKGPTEPNSDPDLEFDDMDEVCYHVNNICAGIKDKLAEGRVQECFIYMKNKHLSVSEIDCLTEAAKAKESMFNAILDIESMESPVDLRYGALWETMIGEMMVQAIYNDDKLHTPETKALRDFLNDPDNRELLKFALEDKLRGTEIKGKDIHTLLEKPQGVEILNKHMNAAIETVKEAKQNICDGKMPSNPVEMELALKNAFVPNSNIPAEEIMNFLPIPVFAEPSPIQMEPVFDRASLFVVPDEVPLDGPEEEKTIDEEKIIDEAEAEKPLDAMEVSNRWV